MSDSKSQPFSISTETIVRVLLLLGVIGVLFLIREILLLLFVAIVIAAAIDPAVDWLQKYKIPRPISVILLYVIIIGVLGLIISLLVPPIAEQIIALAQNLPAFFEKIAPTFESLRESAGAGASTLETFQGLLTNVGNTLARTSSTVFGTVGQFLGGFISLIVILVLTFYLTVREDGIKKFITSILPYRYRDYAADFVERAQFKIGGWIRGQLILGLIIGILVYIGLSLLGVQYALVLAILAGMLELIPFIGPIISAIPAVFLALTTQSWVVALLVVILYIVVQQIENHLLYPKIMQRFLGLNPVVIILSLLIGARLGGVGGLLMAVPFVTVLALFFRDYFKKDIPFITSKAGSGKK